LIRNRRRAAIDRGTNRPKARAMNYVLKSVAPASVFLNSIRIFLVVGLFAAVIKVIIVPDPNMHITESWQKVMATLVFTLVYALVVSTALVLIAWLYNLWSNKFKGISIELDQR
jgi:sterol desaturase/sphingolipid hydroxylase (fatty acid hydroxylase superfamily)